MYPVPYFDVNLGLFRIIDGNLIMILLQGSTYWMPGYMPRPGPMPGPRFMPRPGFVPPPPYGMPHPMRPRMPISIPKRPMLTPRPNLIKSQIEDNPDLLTIETSTGKVIEIPRDNNQKNVVKSIEKK